MSNKSGVSSQVISLPSGGGAVQGIGEKFSPDLFTGTGNFTVPIALPPGRGGFQPQLQLVYSTGQGNGPFGLGWALSVPGIARKTSQGLPRYDEQRDTFVLSGAEDLVPVSGGAAGAQRYRPRTEGLFARIEHLTSDADDYWHVRTKDGLVSTYGTPESRGGSDPATVIDPDAAHHVAAWRLTSTVDPFGNRIEYVYEREPVRDDGPHRWDQVYLSEIRYADRETQTGIEFIVIVRFVYEARPDAFSERRAGFEVRTTRRCVRIEVTTHAGEERAVRNYHLDYLDQGDVASTQLPLNGVSLLSRIRVEGVDGEETQELPPLEVAYSPFLPERAKLQAVTGRDLPGVALGHPSLELADLFGRGLPDLVEISAHAVRYWKNLGGGEFDGPRAMKDAPAGLQLGDPGVQLMDADGDGRIDLMVATAADAGFFSLNPNGEWDRASFQRYRVAPSFNLGDPEVKLVDLDGDGVTDAIRSGARLECFFNDPKTGWGESRRIERGAEAPDVSFADPRVKWGDMTGDGLQGIVLVHSGSVSYWPSLGRGRFGRRVSMKNAPRMPEPYDPRRVLVGDVDGDGLDDLVYIGNRTATI